MSQRELDYIFQKIPDLKEVLRSEYRILCHSEKYSMIYHFWLPDSPEMDDEIFRLEILEVIKALEAIRPSYFLANDRFREIKISEDLNEFLLGNFFPIYGHSSVKKVAMVRSGLLSMQAELETTMEQLNSSVPEQDRTFNFFDDVNPALEWLIFSAIN